jgi:hypothetical protein
MTDEAMKTTQLAQAKLLAESARRLEHPIDALPEGDPASMLLALWHQAGRCAVAAAQAGSDDPTALLERAAGSAELLLAVQALLASPASFDPGEQASAPQRAALIAAFTRNLIQELERPVTTSRWQRALGDAKRFWLPGVVPLVGLLALGVQLIRGPDLASSAVRSLSSQASTCENASCGNATFHTNLEASPWVSYDFGSPRQLRSITVENRTDCCIERAVPLVIETSDDAKTWQEQTRTEQPFYVYRHALKVKARYLRLRVAHKSYLHLRSVSIR